ncbi:MAG: UDP-3-O-[3-hydroxymyristoyl] N-acetylglucosamine deacetylase [Candidatus Riflebacteria bacterium]|nr:UDP-3-O-[3-hydroxymyristoyl] N-acetylglucosamine deacetylase [Candidatus Riflebacteria bacterium]
MKKIKQKSIKKSVELSGIGLHTGNPAKIQFSPAPIGAGIFFRRTDLPGSPTIRADIDEVSEVFRGTTIGKGANVVNTVEHVMSAVYGLEISNLEIGISGGEPPACDGSARPFVSLLIEAGIEEQNDYTEEIGLNTPFSVKEGEKTLEYQPSENLEITFTMDYSEQELKQKKHFVFSSEKYIDEISFARTFGFVHEFEMLKAKQIALGGSLENAVVVNLDSSILNPEGLRDPEEFVKHKILDLFGDLALIGKRFRGHIIANKTGHATNIKFARKFREILNHEKERKKKI